MADEALRARVQALAQALGAGLIEREALVGLLLVALLAGENSLLLGPPGTAKSLLARRLALALREGSFFQVLLTRFTAPEELFGPVSLAALREHDRFERRTAGYLPEAHLALIDEVFKAGPAILNTLLMLLNERLFVNGAAVFPAPLLALVGASNEVPEDESLEALYDRFTLRLVVEPIAGEAAFAALLAAPRAEEEPALDPTLPLSPAEGACTVLVDGVARLGCITLAAQVDGAEITTIEGVATRGQLHPLQQAFHELVAAQCGYCTPGFVLALKALLDEVPDPSDAQIQEVLGANICRCTGYTRILAAAQLARERLQGRAP